MKWQTEYTELRNIIERAREAESRLVDPSVQNTGDVTALAATLRDFCLKGWDALGALQNVMICQTRHDHVDNLSLIHI